MTDEVPPAPLPVRTPAFLVDQAVVLLLGVLPVVALGTPLSAVVSPGRTRTLVFVLLMGIAFGYHLLLEWRWGRTPGKRLFGLRVVASDGAELGFRGSFLRNALDGSHTEYGEDGAVSRLSPTANVRYRNATYRVRSTPTGGQGATWALGRALPLALSALLGGAGLALHTTRE